MFPTASQLGLTVRRLHRQSPVLSYPVWQGWTISAMKMLLQHEENASGYPMLPLLTSYDMNLNTVFLLDISMQNISLCCRIACSALFFAHSPSFMEQGQSPGFFSATGSTIGSQVHNHGYEGLSQQITLSACLWRASKAGNVVFLLEKAQCGRQARQFGLCTTLNPSVVKGGNTLKNCKEKQGAGVDAWVILVWNPSLLAKLKKISWKMERRCLPPSSSHKSSDHGDKQSHKSIKCSREIWHQPLGRTDTELPVCIVLWDFI